MVDDFMVCVDRIIASACFESVNERERLLRGANGDDVIVVTEKNNVTSSSLNSGNSEGCSSMVVRECRICQEEDDEHDMEVPCACNGTLKFAHRKCIQKWCNKKGDITCEICNQVYSPNYTLPPAKSNSDVMAIDIRQAWGPHIDIRDPHFLAFAAAERQFLQSEYDDYAAASSGTIACFRSVAIILMLILLIRQALMVTRDIGMIQEASTFFNVAHGTFYKAEGEDSELCYRMEDDNRFGVGSVFFNYYWVPMGSHVVSFRKHDSSSADEHAILWTFSG